MSEKDVLKRRRAYVKGTITGLFGRLEGQLKLADASPPISGNLALSLISDVEDKLKAVEEFTESICLFLEEQEMQDEIAKNCNYLFDVRTKVSKYKELFASKVPSKVVNASEASVKLPLPKITLDPFENNHKNPFAYYTFKKTFLNALAGIPNLTEAQRLIYLKNFVKGEALNVIEGITVDDAGYKAALDLLDFHFLNVKEIRDKTLDSILALNEVKTLKEVEPLIRTVNSKLHDLQGLGLDLLEDNSAGLILLSKIICNKLPRQFLIELFRETKTNYPDFNQVRKVYQEILIRLQGNHKEDSGAISKWDAQSKHHSKSEDFPSKDVKKHVKPSSNKGVSENKPETSKVTSTLCRFCSSTSHSTINCDTFPTVTARVGVANRKGWCVNCLSGKHISDKCPGLNASLPFKCYKCKKSEHHAAVCPSSKASYSKSSGSSLNYFSNPGVMSPILSCTVSRGRSKAKFVFLLDSGAQFSTICKEAVEKIVDKCRSPPMARLVSSFGQIVGKRTKGYNYTAKLTLPCGQSINVDFFAVENLSFQLTFPMLGNVISNMETFAVPLHPDFPFQGEETIEVMGILGIDVLQHFKPYSHQNVLVHGNNANVIALSNGYIPFGSADLFMSCDESRVLHKRLIEKFVPWDDGALSSDDTALETKGKRKKKKAVKITDVVDHNIVNSNRDKLNFFPPKKLGGMCKFMVNCALEPSASYFDPLQEIFPSADVEYGLDNFYNLESIGIRDEDDSSSDLQQIQNFSDSISFKDGHYSVILPWKKDLLEKVPSNLKVSLAVAERVYKKLEKQNIAEDYENVFDQQEALGIIEPVLERVPEQIWIPHRPVIKNEDNVTTKIRPVFNCSLKMGKNPSLNEAAFPGTDLMNSLLSLIMQFRTNFFVLLADIAKAFLQIRLTLEEDKNRFCFFRKVNGKFVPYRYRTIIFGFVSSPFVLNYIIQYHLAAHSSNNVASLIKEKYYVDNLIFSSNEESMLSTYVESIRNLMLEGGLPLREWVSNYPSCLDSLPVEEKSSSELVKVLGYNYDVDWDALQLKQRSLNKEAATKRQIASTLGSVFDPIGVFNPILMQSKLFIRSLCKAKVDWDQPLDEDFLKSWKSFCDTFEAVSGMQFPRRTFNSDSPIKLCVFTDASKEAYGCAFYVVQNEQRHLLFSKVKASPLKERTLPTLELLAVQLALKCFLTIFSDGLMKDVSFSDVNFFVDSQVVLSWVLTCKAPKKNIFVNNRLKEIDSMLNQIKSKFVKVNLAYVPSQFNLADLVTKPCSAKVFRDKFSTWIYGPDWLELPSDQWPKGQLGCIPHAYQGELVNPVLNVSDPEPILDIRKYSSFTFLLGVMVKVCKFIVRVKKVNRDPVEMATNYLLKQMQSEEFSREIAYLKSPSAFNETPKLVSQLNLFLDQKDLIRSKGRIEKNVDLKYDVVNPLVMAKNHHLTKLLIYYAHCQSMHMGLQSTLNYLRIHGLWIVKARQAVSSVISDCIVCKRYNARSQKYPGPAVLPSARVKLSVPFAHTGVDYTGHYYLRDDQGGKVKVYILIFTCFNTRAIHLEAVSSMTTAEFILAFIRFVNRYGVPLAVYSDNAKSFLQAGSIIQNLLSSSEFEEKFRTASISHKTIPVYAAWYGAVWERMIKTVKECFSKVVGRYTPSHSEFITVLSDVQKVLNNRPLTYRSKENEVDIITPNHFLVGRPIPSLLLGELNVDPEWEYYDEDYSNVLSKTIEWRDSVFRDFKDKWLKEYLLSLREKDRASYCPPRVWKVGEVALFKLPNKAKAYWPLVRILQTFPDDDQVIRTVKILKPDLGEVIVNVNHLISLELYFELENPQAYTEGAENSTPGGSENEDDVDKESEVEVPMATSAAARPTRSTARASRAQTRDLAGKGLV